MVKKKKCNNLWLHQSMVSLLKYEKQETLNRNNQIDPRAVRVYGWSAVGELFWPA